MNFYTIPNELLYQIALYLPTRCLINISSLDNRFKLISQDE